MVSRYPTEIWFDQEWLSLILNDNGLLMRWPDLANQIMRLSPEEVKTAYKIMMWNIYEKMSSEVQKLARPILIQFENFDIEMWLLTAIWLFNIIWQIQAWAQFDIPDDVDWIYDFVRSDWFQMTMMEDLFNQVNYFRNNGKLHPPEMVTIWKIEIARQRWRQAVQTLLDSYNTSQN